MTGHIAVQAFLVRVIAPLAGLALLMRAQRVFAHKGVCGGLHLVDAFRAELGALVGLAALGVAALSLVGARVRVRLGVLIAAQLIALLWLTLDIVSHNFYMVTGTELSAQLIEFAFSSGEGTWSLIIQSTPWWIFVLMVLGVIVALGLPWAPRGLWSRRAALREPAPVARRVVGQAALVAVVGWGFALMPPLWLKQPGFTRAAVVNILASSVMSEDDYLADTSADFGSVHAKLKPAHEGAPNIVIVLMESTRARSTTMYPPHLKTTPFLNELAKSSVFAEEAYAVVPHTSKATITTSCGVEPYLEQPIMEATPGGMRQRCLPRLLAGAGYQTAFFQSATEHFEYSRSAARNMGYQTYMGLEDMSTKGYEKANYFGREDMVMLPPSSAWIDAHRGEGPLMMTYLTLTPHHNYLAPRRRFGYESFVEDLELNNYHNAVRYLDFFSKHLLDMFKEKGLYKNTIFVFVGDHGEGFGEHGRRQHDNVIYQEGLRIPLMIHDGRTQKGQRVPHRVNQMDIVPTLLGMAGFDYEPGWFRGQDMRGLKEDRPMYAHCWYTKRCMSVIRGDFKYVHHFGRQQDEVFNLKNDPMEKTSVLDSYRDAKKRVAELKRWRHFVNATYAKAKANRRRDAISKRAKEPTHRLDMTLGNQLEITGYDIAPAPPYRPGQQVSITYHFRVLNALEPAQSFFVRVGATDGGMSQNMPFWPLSEVHPIHEWRKGQHLHDTHTFAIPKHLNKTLTVRVGLWDNQAKRRLPVRGKDASKTEGMGVIGAFPLEAAR